MTWPICSYISLFFQEPTKTPATCVSAVLNVFSEVLKRKDMTLNDSEDVGKQNKPLGQ